MWEKVSYLPKWIWQYLNTKRENYICEAKKIHNPGKAQLYRKCISSTLSPASIELRVCIQMYSAKDAKSRALQHNMHRWNAAILKLSRWASLYSGREGAFPGSSSSFTVILTSVRWTQQPITVQLNTDDGWLWILKRLHVSCPGSFFHSSSIGSSREA